MYAYKPVWQIVNVFVYNFINSIFPYVNEQRDIRFSFQWTDCRACAGLPRYQVKQPIRKFDRARIHMKTLFVHSFYKWLEYSFWKYRKYRMFVVITSPLSNRSILFEREKYTTKWKLENAWCLTKFVVIKM